MKIPTVELIRRHYPGAEIRPELSENCSVVSSGKAERMPGYRAQYRWESYF